MIGLVVNVQVATHAHAVATGNRQSANVIA